MVMPYWWRFEMTQDTLISLCFQKTTIADRCVGVKIRQTERESSNACCK